MSEVGWVFWSTHQQMEHVCAHVQEERRSGRGHLQQLPVCRGRTWRPSLQPLFSTLRLRGEVSVCYVSGSVSEFSTSWGRDPPLLLTPLPSLLLRHVCPNLHKSAGKGSRLLSRGLCYNTVHHLLANPGISKSPNSGKKIDVLYNIFHLVLYIQYRNLDTDDNIYWGFRNKW